MKLTKATHPHPKWKFSPVATLLFLLSAAAFLYACVLLVLSVARNSLRFEETRLQQPTASLSPAPSVTPNAALDVAAIRTPPPDASPSPTPTVTPSPLPSPTPTETPAPATPTPPSTDTPAVWEAPALNDERADLLIIGMDADAHPDWICILQIRGRVCRALAIPRNTLIRDNRTLADAGSAKTCANLLMQVWPIRYSLTVTLQTDGLHTFVDQFGGVTIDGRMLDGAAASEYLENGPADELLRIGRQQALMRAYIDKLQSLRLLSLLSARLAFEPYIESSLGAADMLLLLEQLRNLDLSRLTFYTLPVDSVRQDGVRSYVPDASLIAKMTRDWRE